MIAEWLWTSWAEFGLVIASSVLGLAAAVVVIRLVGLRSLSKMTSTDFAVTVAIGSILGSVASSSNSLAHGVTAIATLLAVQAVIAVYRRRAGSSAVVDNEPCLLMLDGVFDDEALRRTRVSERDVYAKMRESNVVDLESVRAVVLETTGDVSVLHGEHHLDERLLVDVRRASSGRSAPGTTT